MKKLIWSSAAAAAVLLMAGQAEAVNATGSVAVNASVNATAKLTISGGPVNFPDTDPDVSATITATAIDVGVKARTATGSTSTLTLKANQDLTSGSDTIPASNVSWTAGGAGFVNGTVDKTTQQNVGSWTGPGNNSGTQTFSMVNSWSYVPGSYTMTLDYTLTVP
jgi:hypothetical protein